MNYTLTIEGVDYTKWLVLPVKNKTTLDESLDQCVMTIFAIEKSTPFNRLGTVVFTVNDGNRTKVFRYVVTGDQVRNVLFTTPFKYTHELVLLEETKELERYIIDTKTITNAVNTGKSVPYTQVLAPVAYSKSLSFGSDFFLVKSVPPSNVPRYVTPQEENEFAVIDAWQFITDYIPADVYGNQFSNIKRYQMALYENDNLIYVDTRTEQEVRQDASVIIFPGSKYKIRYWFEAEILLSRVRYGCEYTITGVQDLSNVQVPPPYTIADAVDLVLQSAETLNTFESSRFSLARSEREKLSLIQCPEMSFTKMTLREALSQIGGYIHAIPRLENGMIYYDKLGGNEKFELKKPFYSIESSADIENYCTMLDTNVDNLLDTEGDNAITIIDPDPNLYKTPRTEDSSMRITEDNCVIPTHYPIYKVTKLYCHSVKTSIDGTMTEIGDITKYLYENAEYLALSSYSGEYPYSKNYGLYFTQGKKNIKGLSLFSPDASIDALRNYTIWNILSRKLSELGVTISPLILSMLNSGNLTNLLFRVEYIPLVSARLLQHKPYFDGGKKSVLVYNQSENVVSAHAYGENMKGAVSKLGVIEKLVSYQTKDFSDIPEKGLLIDGYYVMSSSIEFLPDYFRVTLALSKDYNKISEYIGIKSQQRYYEVSEKQSVDRYVTAEDFCIINDKVVLGYDFPSFFSGNPDIVGSTTTEYSWLFSYSFDSFWRDPIINGLIANSHSSIAKCYGIGYYGNVLPSVVLPVVTKGFGNSSIFTFSMDDNFSAGDSSTTGVTGADRTQTFTKYGDDFGRITGFDISFLGSSVLPDNYLGGGNETSYQDLLNWGRSLPKPISDTGEFAGPYGRITLNKDSRERIAGFTYQLNFVSDNKDYVIGSKLASNNVLVKSQDENNYLKLYVFPYELSKFTDPDIDEGTLISGRISAGPYVLDTDSVMAVEVTGLTSTVAGKSWALFDNKENSFYWGKNVEISIGDLVGDCALTFVNRLDSLPYKTPPVV